MERPLRILHYSPGMRAQLGGVFRAVVDWCTVLAARGNEVVIVAYDAPDLPADWDGSPGKPKLVAIPAANRPNGFVCAEAVRIWDGVLSGGGIAHLHCPWTASNMQMSRAARRRGVPYVVSIHGMLDDWPMARSRLKKRLFLATGGRRYLRQADTLHYTADAERDQARKWVPGSRSTVLPCLVDLAPYQRLPGPELARARFAISGDIPAVVFLSRLDEQKGVHILIEAAAILRKRSQAFKLILAGPTDDPDYLSRLNGLIERYNLKDVIQFVGLVKGVEKLSLYQAADLFVLPTQHENMGLVLIEAMAAGAAVLTTRGSDFWPHITEAGGTVCDGTAEALSDSMAQLLKNRGGLTIAGQRSRAWVMQRFDVDRMAGEYEQLYRRLIQDHHSAA